MVLKRAYSGFARTRGIRFLSELDLNTMREWRGTWELDSLSRYKRQGQALGFLWFCERAGWYPRNYASDITRGLGKIKVKARQTGYFQPKEYAAVIDATYAYSDRPTVDKHNSLTVGGDRIRALTEVMRWTGLRIRDAVTLEKNRLSQDPATGMWSVMVYQKKTGDPVYCPIPPDVAKMLLTVPPSQKGNTNDQYFFWTGHGTPKTITTNWQRSYVKLFKLANLKEPDGTPKRCHAHMLRDTFAVESLLSGMRVEEVSTILGHSSVKITERHYMPWVRARQTSLNQSVMKSWIRQGKNQTPRRKRRVGRFAAHCRRRVRRVAGQWKPGRSWETWSWRTRDGIGGQRERSSRLRPPPTFRMGLRSLGPSPVAARNWRRAPEQRHNATMGAN